MNGKEVQRGSTHTLRVGATLTLAAPCFGMVTDHTSKHLANHMANRVPSLMPCSACVCMCFYARAHTHLWMSTAKRARTYLSVHEGVLSHACCK